MSKDIMGANINVGDIVVAPFGKNFSKVCEVVKLRPKTSLVVPIDQYGKHDGRPISRHLDCLVVVNSITNKLEALGL